MPGQLTDADRQFLVHTIKLSRHALEDEGKTPFEAILVADGRIVSEGTSSVVELQDPTAHAEVMACVRPDASSAGTCSLTRSCTPAANPARCA